jgi:primosomal protein N' (replication factor Y)
MEVLGSPRFDDGAAELAQWIASEYVAPLADAVRLFLPSGSVPEVEKEGESWRLREPVVGRVEERVVERVQGAGYTPAATAHRQRAVLDALAAGPVTTSELAATLGPVSDVVRRLGEVGAVKVRSQRRLRHPDVRARPAPRHQSLSAGQKSALDAVISAGPGETVLLHGVTGSGKTEVYLRAIENVLAQGRSAIMLVPEISLTPQTVGRFRSRFGDDIAVLHSRLSPGERFDQWDRAGTGAARVVIGARSALFAPVRDLGLIVIDEEHESSYKQASSPRYHARAVATRLAHTRDATLVLGSATPCMETLYRVQKGDISSVVLPERVAGGTLPQVNIVDMGQEFLNGNRSMFSEPLLRGLRDVAARGEKAVLLLNRRGFASFLLCRECGYVPGCDRCSTSLTFHQSGSRLVCHHCGVHKPVPAECPECGSPYIRRFGAGTQRVVAELQDVVPELSVVRMDTDTTSGRGGHENRLAEFEAMRCGVLVGTQMVAKGLDYPEVTLVGVVNADTTLHLPDLRAGERTYQMLEQVAGRAGRGERPGTIFVQTYWPEHPAIVAVAHHDPSEFYRAENRNRAGLRYPPYGRIANLLFTSRSSADARTAAEAIADALSDTVPDGWEVLGPVPAPLQRIKDRHRWHVLLKTPPENDVASVIAQAVSGTKRPAGCSLAVDVDPLDLM